MKLTTWISQQVQRLEGEISSHSVFSTSEPATHEELADLRAKVALHTYLKQQLLRREVVSTGYVRTDSGRFEAVSV